MNQLPLALPDPADGSSPLLGWFEQWLSTAPGRSGGDAGHLSHESAEVYRDMWGSFAAHCRAHHLDPLARLSVEELRVFLQGTSEAGARPRNGDLSPRYAWRMLQLIDRVLSHAAWAAGLPRPMAAYHLLQQPPYRHANASDRSPLPEVLSPAEVRLLVTHVKATLAPSAATAPWKAYRDCAAAALMLGAGLSPGDVRALPLTGVVRGEGTLTVTVPADGVSPAHEAPVAPWAAQALAQWLAHRQRLQIPGPQVFPSTLSGKAWAHPSCHKALVALLETAGVQGGAPFRLRHTHVLQQLQRGVPPEELARWMGFVDTQPLQRYRAWLNGTTWSG